MKLRKLFHESLLWQVLQWLACKLQKPEMRCGIFPIGQHEKQKPQKKQTSKTEQSVLYELLQKLNCALCEAGKRIRQLWEHSRTAEVVAWFRHKAQESVLMHRTVGSGTATILLICLALYPVLDSVFKFVLQINVLTNSWNEILLAIGLLTVIAQCMRSQTPLQPRLTPAMLPIIQFPIVGICLLCTVMLFPRVGYAGYYITMGGVLWFFVVTRIMREEKDLMLLCSLMVAVATGISIIGILEYIFAIPIPKQWLETAETGIRTRAFAIFANPNQLGEYLELMLPLTVGMLYLTTEKRQKLYYVGCAVLMLLAGLFTMSRGAWSALAVGLFVFALLEDKRLLLLFFVIGVCVLALPFVTSRLEFVFSNAFIYSAAKGGRVLRWQTALRYLRQANPWLGLGFGMYGGEVANNYPMVRDWTYYWVDNYYIKLLAENGIIGLVSFCVMQLGVLYTGLRAWANAYHTKYRALTAGMLAGMLGVLVHGMFECMFDVKFVSTLYWTIAAMLLWIGFLQKRKPKKRENEALLAVTV